MRWIRHTLGLLLLPICLGGCATSEPQLKPPKAPEEFNAPPDNDSRYNKPIEYPKEAIDQDPLNKAKGNNPGGPGGPGGGKAGMPGRMGGTPGF
jgi:hypothetical protein